NTIGNDNTGVGFSALVSNTVGANNTALGVSALYTNSSGSNNTALGMNALYACTGTSNLALGFEAGYQATSGSDNVFIANQGQSADSDVIRIGTPGTQTAAYIAGISGANVNGTAVLVTSSGQLGIASSSRRFKEEIHDMDKASEGLMLLRPVTFRYKQGEGGIKPLQYGLIGEEVARVYPDLVVYDAHGQVGSLKYHELPALLLNELQKQHKTIEELQARIAALESLLRNENRRGAEKR
ncbi:MAG: tail fiber domain-containing protein, partial [Acidobacteriaceae bacterium]|nr:tail fiber domain-containing protein [Acidobacteriaceae bacterium]